MPGPWSSKVSRSPFRPPLSRASRHTVPPPPYCTVLRASSLAAVTIFVWSTRPSPCATAQARTACLTSTTSPSVRTGITSRRRTVIVPLGAHPHRLPRAGVVAPARQHLQQRHPLLDVQRRAHAGERQPELHERDR